MPSGCFGVLPRVHAVLHMQAQEQSWRTKTLHKQTHSKPKCMTYYTGKRKSSQSAINITQAINRAIITYKTTHGQAPEQFECMKYYKGRRKSSHRSWNMNTHAKARANIVHKVVRTQTPEQSLRMKHYTGKHKSNQSTLNMTLDSTRAFRVYQVVHRQTQEQP